MIVHELADIKNRYGDARRTKILEADHNIEINEEDFKQVEECVILLTQSDFLKRVNQKSYVKSAQSSPNGDPVKCIIPSATDKRVQIFTDLGNLYTLPTGDIPECKLKDKGKPLAAILAGIDPAERIAGVFSVADYDEGDLFFATQNGRVKRTALSEYDVRNKKIVACGLADGDRIISVHLQNTESDWLVLTQSGMAIRFPSADVSVMGRSAKGVKSVQLSKGDSVVMASPVGEQDDLVMFTDLGYAKITRVYNFEAQRRGGKGVKAVTLLKKRIDRNLRCGRRSVCPSPAA